MSRGKSVAEQAEGIKVPGPLAPWKLVITVVATAVLTGQQLLDATSSGVGVDFALLRSFAVAALVWFSVGMVNRVLVAATVQAIEAERAAARHGHGPDQQDFATSER